MAGLVEVEMVEEELFQLLLQQQLEVQPEELQTLEEEGVLDLHRVEKEHIQRQHPVLGMDKMEVLAL
tara:strand:+ start:683 stop:883 length:201 start_codon:yes stop_codon:yes gene_type:complete